MRADFAGLVLVEYDNKVIAGRLIPASSLPENRIFAAMWRRCTNPNNIGYKDYGARGITICERWQSFPLFYVDMGPRPTPKHSIERRDNHGNYEPNNCYWATRKQQQNNRRPNRPGKNAVHIEVAGERKWLPDIAASASIPETTLRSRLRMGWGLEKALSEPVRPTKSGTDRKPHKKRKKTLTPTIL